VKRKQKMTESTVTAIFIIYLPRLVATQGGNSLRLVLILDRIIALNKFAPPFLVHRVMVVVPVFIIDKHWPQCFDLQRVLEGIFAPFIMKDPCNGEVDFCRIASPTGQPTKRPNLHYFNGSRQVNHQDVRNDIATGNS